jgi:acetylornithine deacetylase/succinyl-diaminopimelate desuccinylase-like protein
VDHPPFSADREGGFIYGRGTVDDKDNVVATLMTMLMLKRQNVALDRDVIALFEAGEEGTSSLGIQFMANEHYEAIDAEFCYAEGGSVTRTGGVVKFASIQTVEKIPRAITVTSRGVAGHGSVPLEDNALAHLGEAVGKIAAWTPPMRINETTAAYFKRLASVSSPEEAKRYQALLSPDPKVSGPPTTTCARTSRATGRCCDVAVADDDRRRLSHQRHSVGRHRRRSIRASRPTRIRRSSSSW